MARYLNEASPWLTLREISYSEVEMLYVTCMRNVIQFQIQNSEDYQYLRRRFWHRIEFFQERLEELNIILCHTLSEVVKSHVLVHNPLPFHLWRTIVIDNNGFPLLQNQVQVTADIAQLADRNILGDRFLVPTFSSELECTDLKQSGHLRLYKRLLFTNDGLDKLPFNSLISDITEFPESKWRRVYSSNDLFFFSRNSDIAFYIKEQTLRRRKLWSEREVNRLTNLKF